MAVMAAISPGILILLLSLQNTVAQQCSSNVGSKNSAGTSQQSLQKAPCNLNQVTQNSGLNFNYPPQPNMQQMNFQQQSNIQQAPFIQQSSNMQPQSNPQQDYSQQPVNSITNSQLLQQQQNQNLASNIYSALHSIKQSSQNQGPNNAKANPSQQSNYEQVPFPQTYVQSNPIFTVPTPIMNTPQIALQPSSSFVEYPQFQPSFTFQTAPNSNVPSQQDQQMFAVPAQKTYTNGQNNGYTGPGASSYAAAMQGPIVMVPGAQTNTPQSVPIVFTLQPSPTVSAQSQSAQPLSQIIEGQPIVYTVQTQPSSYSNQNQQKVSNQPQGSHNTPTDNQSLISYILSQMQNPHGNNNALASILPAMLSSKSEKSSSMKALLPLIFNMLNERRNGCGCPHCECNNNYHNHDIQEPLINTGYSKQKNYSLQELNEDVSSKITENENSTVMSTNKVDATKNVSKNNATIKSAETSEEDEEVDDSEEDYDDK